MSLCSHETFVEAEDNGDGTVSIRIESDCEDVAHYAKLLTSASLADITEIKGSRILDLASEASLTPTCLVPAGVFNACWLATGMISKNLARMKESICLYFVD